MTGSGQKRVDPFGWLIRVAWGRRLETGLTFVATDQPGRSVWGSCRQFGAGTLCPHACGLRTHPELDGRSVST
jgi:hypothetical protein